MSSSSARRRPDRWLQHNSLEDWSNLPYDLLVLIANKLNAIEDFFAFSAVCHSWRLIHLNKNWKPNATITPWLILDVNHNGEALIRRISNTCTSKALKLRFPNAKPSRYWGSSYGWVISIDNDLVIGLLNPISRAFIQLPLCYTLPTVLQNNAGYFDVINKANILKVRGELVTVITLCYCNYLCFAKSRDSSWTTVALPFPSMVASVVCVKDEIYATSTKGTIFLVEIDGPDPPKATVITNTPNHESYWEKIYLVESLGDLLMIFQYTYINPISAIFKVYKFDFSTKVWMIVESLGERVIFLDNSHTLSVEAGDEFRSNSIYFVEDSVGWNWGLKQANEWQYCGVFHMEDKTTETFSLNMCNWDGCVPMCAYPSWLIPSL